jgi:hypothetical protein
MTKNQLKRKRENRELKRQLEKELKIQAKQVKNETPIGKFINLDKSFLKYSVEETMKELASGKISKEREELLREVLTEKDKILKKTAI